MLKKISLSLVAVSTISFAGNLLNDAKSNGLEAIPTSQLELLKLIENRDNRLTDGKIELGKMLYFDTRLSKSNLISCNTCHNLSMGGDDGVSAAIGHKWTANPHHLNSPTVYNAVFAQKQFWDGRSPDLEDQATGPIQAGPEMAMLPKDAEKNISSIPEYVTLFNKVFPNEKITLKNIGKAIGAFERTLVTSSKYDDFLNGDQSALNSKEKQGLRTFIDKGCVSCHNGIALGGSMQPFPLMDTYKYANLGDFKGNKKGMVKTPTLRNITETEPYFHNGGTFSLKEAIEIMGKTQLRINLTKDEISNIEIFLKSLEGKKPNISLPILPKSTKETILPNSQ